MSNQKTIKGKKVEAYHLGVKDQLKLLTFLTIHVGGSVKGLEKISDNDFDNNLVKTGASVLGSFVDNLKELDDDKAIYWMEQILVQIRIDGAKVTMEGYFSGQLAFLFDVVQYGLEVNFGDFLHEKLGTIKELMVGLMKGKLEES